MRTITGTLLKCALFVLVVLPLVVGCASRGEFAARQTSGINDNHTATVGAVKSGYVLVNGLNMYYEIQGIGRPLVLIHGGVCTIDTCFGKVRPPLAKNWKTVAVELQGHGHTADVDRPLSFEQMAEDTAALLRQLKIENADLIGYSVGGGVALRIAMRYPDLVRKLVVIGTGYNNDGLVPGLLENFKTMKPEDIPLEFREAYARTAPDPKQWPTLVAKVVKLGLEFKGWRPEEIQSIKAPVLVMIGDADIVRPEHTVQMFRMLPHAQLAVLPGTDHFAPMTRPDWIAPMIEAFLNAPMPKAPLKGESK
jgi:pimeloyl-ACP methyl ester carboxylesterase